MGYFSGADLSIVGDKVVNSLSFRPRKVTFSALSGPTSSATSSSVRSYIVTGYMIDSPSGIKEFTNSITTSLSGSGVAARASKFSACFALYSTDGATVAQELNAVSFNDDGFTVNCRVALGSSGAMWLAEA